MGALVAFRGSIAHPDRVGHDPEGRQHPGQTVGGDRLAGFRFCPWAALDCDQGLRPARLKLSKIVVSEAGASVYSASAFASQELPDLDVTKKTLLKRNTATTAMAQGLFTILHLRQLD